MTTRIKLRRDTAANWTSNDPVLALGEAGYDTTNNELRVGDGTTVWSLLSAVGGTSNKITAQKTYSDTFSDGSGQTFTYTTGSIAVQMGNNNGLYLNDLLYRWVEYFDGNLDYPYNYSNINLVINPDTDNLASTVTNVTSDFSNPALYTITLGTAHPEPITINDIDFNYTYINTIGLDVVNDFFGMATGDDDIDIRSGRDIDLIAADDINIEAGSSFDLTYRNLDDNSPNDGINIRTETTSTDYTWTFRFDGSLELPGGLSLPFQTNKGYDVLTNLNAPTLRLSNDSTNQVIVTGPAATETYTNAPRIVIQGQRGYGSTSTTGEGGDVYIWGGVGGETNGENVGVWGEGGGSGGDVKLRGGEGLNDTGGYVRIEGGNVAHFNTSTTGNPGFVEITGGDVTVENAAGSSYGGNVRITGGRAYSATTQSGVVQVITGGYYSGVPSDKIWTFGNDGTLTLPGAITRVVAGTVAKTGIAYNIGTATALADSTYIGSIVDGNYGPFTRGLVTFTVVVTSGVAAYTVTATTGNTAVGAVIGTLDTGDLGGTSGSTSNISVADVVQGVTAIDLTKSINKLTDGFYTLADGVEGQIMYLVRQTGTIYDAVTVIVANARINGVLYTSIEHYPFSYATSSIDIDTLIFTDGAWQAVGGEWD